MAYKKNGEPCASLVGNGYRSKKGQNKGNTMVQRNKRDSQTIRLKELSSECVEKNNERNGGLDEDGM